MLLLCGSTHWHDAKARRVVVPIVRHYERDRNISVRGIHTSEEKGTGEREREAAMPRVG